jgi:hypothetical protein
LAPPKIEPIIHWIWRRAVVLTEGRDAYARKFFFYSIKSEEDIKEPLDILTRSAPPENFNPLPLTHIIYIEKRGKYVQERGPNQTL